MNTLNIADLSAVAKQIIRISDIRQKMDFTDNSRVQTNEYPKEDSRYYSVAAMIATTIEPQKAGAVAKKLLAGLDTFQKENLVGVPQAEAEASREMFV